jgi:hypothetical protein
MIPVFFFGNCYSKPNNTAANINGSFAYADCGLYLVCKGFSQKEIEYNAETDR